MSGVGWSAPKPHGLMGGERWLLRYSYQKGEMDARQVKQQAVPTKARKRGGGQQCQLPREAEPVD